MLTYTQKRELKANQRRILIDSIEIQLASPQQIRSWAQRRLPTGALVGQVTNSKTLDYKNHKPLKDGLFCERIFGPVRDFVCACGKQQPKDGSKYCLQCGVEFTHSRVRRLRLGFIQLASSVTHIWFLKGRPSYISLLLGKKKRLVVAIAYCNASLIEQDLPETFNTLREHPQNIGIDCRKSAGIDNSTEATHTSEPFTASNGALSNGRGMQQIANSREKNRNGSISKRLLHDSIARPSPNAFARRSVPLRDLKSSYESLGDGKTSIENGHRLEKKALPFQKQTTRGSFPNRRSQPSGFYSQAQSLPILPSFATTYFTRTALVNYLVLPPRDEDRPLSLYCQKTRWWPLVDIHDFMAEQPLQFLNRQMSSDPQSLKMQSASGDNDGSWFLRENNSTLRKASQSIEHFRERAQPGTASFEKQYKGRNQEASRQSLGPKLNVFRMLASPMPPPSEEQQTGSLHMKTPSSDCNTIADAYVQSTDRSVFHTDRSVFHTDANSLANVAKGGSSLEMGAVLRTANNGNQRVDSTREEGLSQTDKAAINEILSYTGGGALEVLLKRFDMATLASFMGSDLRDIYATLRRLLDNPKQTPAHLKLTKLLKRLLRRRAKIARRFKLAKLFFQSKRQPEWMILSVLPVLPPKLRPIERRDGLSYTSDLNRLYQMVLNRNRRFQKLIVVDRSTVTATQRLLQDAVDGLLENGKGGSKPFSHPNGHPLVSLSDKLKGKKGRFRLNLLGKRVDYSGRSVIVVEPKLRLHECGLPKEMALELFRFFLIRQLVVNREASNIIMAKRLLKQRLPLVWNTLRDLINHHPVLLNRAPTLHRLGIQAFQPILVEGSALKLHPLVCSGFNADFDGDQMAVHIPLSFHARAEAWNLLWSRNNLLSPATGQPILVPSQDMVLGWYYVTTMQSTCSRLQVLRSCEAAKQRSSCMHVLRKTPRGKDQERGFSACEDSQIFDLGEQFKEQKRFGKYFSNLAAVLLAYDRQDLDLHSPLWVRFEGILESSSELEKPLEVRIDGLGNSVQVYTGYQRQIGISNPKPTLFIRTHPGRVLLNSILHSQKD